MRFIIITGTMGLFSLCALPAAQVRAATNQTCVIDGCGGWASNATFTTVTAACQPGPVGDNSTAGYLNGSGFLQAFVLDPTRDTDDDGIADEGDPDDDNDGLPDTLELAGAAFDPTTATDPLLADADGDGMDDGGEADAGTDPFDVNSIFRIIRVTKTDADIAVTWQSREGYTYRLLAAANVSNLLAAPIPVATITASGGSGPWAATESSATNTSGDPKSFYRVEVNGRP